jgi:hypothetical protein
MYSVVALCRGAYLPSLRGKWWPVRLAACVLVALYWFIPIEVGAVLLFAYGAMVLFGVGVNVVCRPFVRVVYRLTANVRQQPLRWICRWINRVTWVMVVMPCHSLGQVVKATGNLLSIFVWERGLRLKVLVITWVIAVLVGFLALFFFNEIVLVIAVAPLLGESAIADLVFGALWLALYLGALRLCLPAIDLLLDVGNYHLASAADRAAYATVLDRAMVSTPVQNLTVPPGENLTVRRGDEPQDVATSWRVRRRRLAAASDSCGA